jgi:hypothetical protein
MTREALMTINMREALMTINDGPQGQMTIE